MTSTVVAVGAVSATAEWCEDVLYACTKLVHVITCSTLAEISDLKLKLLYATNLLGGRWIHSGITVKLLTVQSEKYFVLYRFLPLLSSTHCLHSKVCIC